MIDVEPVNSEIMCCKFQLPNKVNKFVFLCLCYRPNDRNMLDFLNDLHDILEYTEDKGFYNVLFMGDFNCKNNDWCRSDVSNLDGQLFKSILLP